MTVAVSAVESFLSIILLLLVILLMVWIVVVVVVVMELVEMATAAGIMVRFMVPIDIIGRSNDHGDSTPLHSFVVLPRFCSLPSP